MANGITPDYGDMFGIGTKKPKPPLFSSDPLIQSGPVSSGMLTAPQGAGSAMDRYYENLVNLMPSRGQQGLSDVANLAGAFSSGQKANRVVEGDLTQNFDQMMLQRERDQNLIGLDAAANRRTDESDALKKLATTGYLASGGSQFKPTTFQLGGKQVTTPDFGFGPRPASEAQMQGASELQRQLLSRLSTNEFDESFTPDFSYTPHELSSYAKPGVAERVGDYAGVGLGTLGAIAKIPGVSDAIGKIPGVGGFINNLMGNSSSTSSLGGLFGATPGAVSSQGVSQAAGQVGSKLGSVLGKAAPIAGAAMGTIGLLKDRGLGSNIMNGAMAGAGYGSFLPGLGTLAGMGIGAGIGALRGIGGPSSEEVAGREGAREGEAALAALATPEQRAGAQQAGFNQALPMIMVRDALNRKGDPQADAKSQQMAAQLHAAEKQGPEAVNSIINQMMQLVRA